MVPQTPQPGVIESELSWTTGAISNVPLADTQQQRKHQLVHHDGIIADNRNMAQDAHLKIVRQTGRSNCSNQHAIRCEYLHVDVDSGQLRMQFTDGVQRELCDWFIAACNGKPPCLKMEVVRTAREIEHHDVISTAILAD